MYKRNTTYAFLFGNTNEWVDIDANVDDTVRLFVGYSIEFGVTQNSRHWSSIQSLRRTHHFVNATIICSNTLGPSCLVCL